MMQNSKNYFYSFELSLSDVSDEIFGNAKITILDKNTGMKSFRLDLNKCKLRCQIPSQYEAGDVG